MPDAFKQREEARFTHEENERLIRNSFSIIADAATEEAVVAEHIETLQQFRKCGYANVDSFFYYRERKQ